MKYKALFINKKNKIYKMTLTRSLSSSIEFCKKHLINNKELVSFRIEGVDDIDDNFV